MGLEFIYMAIMFRAYWLTTIIVIKQHNGDKSSGYIYTISKLLCSYIYISLNTYMNLHNRIENLNPWEIELRFNKIKDSRHKLSLGYVL